ncbi:MAG: cadherin domain-containing protein, partial [Planctomycetaceae bacterium]
MLTTGLWQRFVKSLSNLRVVRRPLARTRRGYRSLRPADALESRLLLSRLISWENDEGFTRVNNDGAGQRVEYEQQLGIGPKDGSQFLLLTLTTLGNQRYEMTLPTIPGDTFRAFGSLDRNATSAIGYGRVLIVSANNSSAQKELIYLTSNTIGQWNDDKGSQQVTWTGNTKVIIELRQNSGTGHPMYFGVDGLSWIRAPHDDMSGTNKINENVTPGTWVSDLEVHARYPNDPDPLGSQNRLSYVVTTNSAQFASTTYQGSTGKVASIQTANGFVPNVEVQQSHTVGVSAQFVLSDGTVSRGAESAFNIEIQNVNEAPTNITLSNSTVPENQPVGTVVGIFSTDDPDIGDTFTYTLVGGTGDIDNACFTIDGNKLKTAKVFNYESKNSYSIRVRSTDAGGLWCEKSFPITVSNVNEAPTNITLSNSTVPENQPVWPLVGILSTDDVDIGDTFAYTLVGGTGDTDNACFTIDGNKLKTAKVFNYESKSSYSIRIRTTDQDGLTYDKVFSISVSDVNEAPTNLVLSDTTLPANPAVGTAVGTFASSDPDAENTFSYTLVSGNGDTDNSSFAITDGILKTAVALDLVTKGSYSIRVRTTDQGGLTYDKTFTIEAITADLSLTLTNESSRVIPGTSTTYTLTVANSGPSSVTAASVTDVLPAGTTFLSGSAGVSYDSATRTVSYVTGTLGVSASESFTITLAVDAALIGTLTNTASVTATGVITDRNLANNTARDSDALTAQVDLSVSTSNGAASVIPGTTTTYTVTVTNSGPSSVTGATVTDVLPMGVTFVGGSSGVAYN